MAVTVKSSKSKYLAIGIGVILALAGIFFGTRAFLTRAADEAPKAFTIKDITATSATVSWETTNPVQQGVRYGLGPTAADLTLIAPEIAPAKDHRVDLTLLEPGKTYYVEIIGAVAETEFKNGDTPWSFTTLAEDGSIPTSGNSPTRAPIQRLVIPDSGSAASSGPSINCKTETNCDLIKANFAQGCSTSDYVACTFRNK